ncbi:UNVERIFIED_CONTAM: hypothetical protein RMT77_009388 [Armadillidium vulgare]
MNKIEPQPDTFEDSSLKKETSQNHKITVERNVKKVPPDGGWGWMVVFGSFFGLILAPFPGIVFSILFSPLLMSHSVSSTKISWIFNFYSLVWSLATIFIGPLCNEFGWRKIAIFGGIANSLSVLLSAFAPNPEFLMFSFSILGGIGAAIGYTSVLVVSQYFEKHRGLALGITSIGGCISNFLGPILANYMLEHYGYMGASLIFGAILLNQCVGGALYQPIEWHLKYKEVEIEVEDDVNEKLLTNCKMTDKLNGVQEKSLSEIRRASVISVNSTFEISNSLVNISTSPTILEANEDEEPADKNNHSALWSILKSTYSSLKSLKYMRVQLISWGYCGLLLGYVNFRMFVPFVIINAGYSLETAAWCSSIGSIGNVVGRIIMTLLSDRKFFNVRYGFMFGLFLIGTSVIAFSLVNDIKFFIISICIWGLGIGFTIALNITVMISVMGVEMLPAVLGAASLLRGFGGIALGTLAGVVRDATSSYTYALWMLGGCEFAAFCLWLLMPCAEKFDENKYSKNQKKQKT